MPFTRLRGVRKARSLTQKSAAELLRCDQTTVSLWERGEGFPTPRHRARLELAFGEPVEALMAPDGTGDLPKRPRTKSDAEPAKVDAAKATELEVK